MSEQRRTYAPVSPNLQARQTAATPPNIPPLQQAYYPTNSIGIPQSNSYLSASNVPLQSPYQPPYQQAYQPPSLQFGQSNILSGNDDEMDQDHPTTKPTQPAKRGRKPKVKPEDSSLPDEPAEPVKPYPGQLEGIVVRNKFPTARIKRIMQADEDVGKVAQVTPTAVNKALELFIVDFVLRSVEVAKSKGQKKVTTQHMKHVVTSEERFDWCKDFVGKIPDPPEKGGAGDDENGAGTKRKRAGGGSRRAKAKDSDDD
ncbi:MAG: hypothetical protein GOMPHAMPRED_006319 [Gomphillus americanus]|uniref:Transcription factor CBF/NF-Y/archaeal histone domain-containing protein n=1 Tax=Gomphillus americanus TaxID=1940652 RepID=A0A8H3ENH4_9LECA|nr:MAG: hypothetical protein GOMPHAMPRED_006319 [Gomphillus americanus]